MTQEFTLPEQDLVFIHGALRHRIKSFKGRVLVTGSTGFFGRWMVEALVWMRQVCGLEIDVSVMVRDSARFKATAPAAVARTVHAIETDMAEPITRLEQFQFIIHLASPLIRSGEISSFHEHLHKAARGMENVITLARQTEDCKVLFASSGAVYGDYFGVGHGSRPFKENYTGGKEFLDEKLIYSQTKRYLELILLTAGVRYNLDAKIARCFSFVGPYLPLNSNYAIGNFINSALERTKITIQGDGRARRTYMYAADMVVAMIAIMLEGRNGAAYNVGSEQSYSLLEVAQMVAAKTHYSKVEVLNRNISTGAGPEYVPDLSQFHRDFHGLPTHPLEQAIAKTLLWHQDRTADALSRQAN
jgi:nucleoside-diphosphate-sugar epimerase